MTTPTTTRTRAPAATALALDKYSHEWLSSNYPDLVTAIEIDMTRGATPQGIRFLVQQRVGPDRESLALRCEQAARHMMTLQMEAA